MRQKYLFLLFCIFANFTAVAATCPDGYLAVSRDSNTIISTPCPSGYTAMRTISHNCSATDSTCYPELLCTAGSYDLNVGTNTVPLWSRAFTTKSLKVKSGDKICYAQMAADVVSGRLKVMDSSGTIYSHANIYECKINISSTGTNSASTMTDNRTNWTATVDGKTISGISACVATSGFIGDTASNIAFDSVTMSNNIYCWCRAVSPYVSLWTYATYYEAAGYTGCYRYCNGTCASRATGTGTYDVSFRTALINSMTK